jgi:hypothetical protein
MKKLDRTKTVYKLVLFALFLSLFSNSVFATKKVVLEDMTLELKKINYNKLGIIIWDQRPMVADQSQPETFLGYRRSYVGIAHPVFMKSKQAFSTLLLKKIKSAYHLQGVEVNIIESSPFEKKEQIKEKIRNYNHNRVLMIKLNKLYFDGVFEIEYVVDVEIQLLNSKGELLFSKYIIEKIPLGSSHIYEKTVPKKLKTIIESLLNENDVVNAIDKKYSEINVNQLEEYDLIITKEGEEIESKIIEINQSSINYKLHRNLDGPVMIINISEVFMIKYKNGDKKVFK